MSREEALLLLRNIREGRIYVIDGIFALKVAIQDALGEEVKLW